MRTSKIPNIYTSARQPSTTANTIAASQKLIQIFNPRKGDEPHTRLPAAGNQNVTSEKPYASNRFNTQVFIVKRRKEVNWTGFLAPNPVGACV
jgi:hypothetical protein